MIKEIKYDGITTAPSDYEAPDGALHHCLNMYHRHGALHSLPAPGEPVISGIPAGSCIFLHRPSDGSSRFFCYPDPDADTATGGAFSLCTASVVSDDHPLLEQFRCADNEKILSVTAIGNIIVAATNTCTHYLRFNPAAPAHHYQYLGTGLPDISLTFGLDLRFEYDQVTTDQIKIKKTTAASAYNNSLKKIVYQKSHKPRLFMRSDITQRRAATYVYDFFDISSGFSLKDDTPYLVRLGTNKLNSRYMHYAFGFKLFAIPDDAVPVSGMEQQCYLAKDCVSVTEKVAGVANIGVYATCSHSFVSSGLPENTRLGILFWSSVADSSRDLWFDHDISFQVSLYSYLESSLADGENYIILYNEESVQAVAAAVNKFIAQRATETGRFIFPFFARFALRLYDGSNAPASAPVLMLPNSGCAPAMLFCYKDEASVNYLYPAAFCADLLYKISAEIPKEWEDLIAGVDIFLSQQIWPFHQGAEYSETRTIFSYPPVIDSYGVGRMIYDSLEGGSDDPEQFKCRSLNEYFFRMVSTASDSAYPKKDLIEFDPKDAKELRNDIASVSAFYHYAFIPREELKADDNFHSIEVPRERLSTLVTRATLEDALPYRGFAGAALSSYNRRLEAFGASVILPEAEIPVDCNNFISPAGHTSDAVAQVTVPSADGQRIVRSVVASVSEAQLDALRWFYYPDSRATMARIIVEPADAGSDTPVREITMPLRPHDFLPGAYWLSEEIGRRILSDDADDSGKLKIDRLKADVPVSERRLSSIYLSEVDNPFLFRASRHVSVGEGRVLALASAVQALSQGQFGQFPRYAFTSEGVWAMEVGATGSYTSRQPVVRDVIADQHSIVSLDSSVVFATSRALMMLRGSDCRSISEIIRPRPGLDPYSMLPAYSAALSAARLHPDSIPLLPSLSQILQKPRFIYDYSASRLIIYNPGIHAAALLLSLEDMKYTYAGYHIYGSVNSYPDAMALFDDGTLRRFPEDSCRLQPSLLLSRPLRLDAPDVLKTVDCVIQRGDFCRGHVQSVLYGSRDLRHWHLVWSSKDHILRGFSGTPYKYFRIALICSLGPGESLSGASIRYTPRLTNHLR